MLKRLLTYTLVVSTAVWSVGLLATPLAVGAASSGDLIKLQCSTGAEVNDPCKAVYYLGADGKRYVFPNEKTYKTWYSSFSGVQIVSASEMSSYPIGGNVTYRPGVKLVKIQTDPKVYAVSGNGTLRWITTGELAVALYGSNWATLVEDVSDAFFVNYTIGDPIDSADDYDKAEEMADSETINEDKNLGGGASTGSRLTVALAADTPATGIVLGNTVNNKFTKVNLTAAADGNIVVDRLVVERGGTIASDAAFSSIALLDATTGVRIGDTKTLNSVHQATFNEDFTVNAGTTRSIYLVGNMGTTSSYAGEIPTLNLASVSLVGTASVVGSLPIVGNYQNINGTITVGALTLANGNDNPSASTQKVGTTNYIVSGFKLTANSVEDFKVTHVTFNQGGTADNEDVVNLDLFVEDVLVGTVAAPADDNVTFDLSSNPILIEEGKTKQFNLQLDINSGSSRTIQYNVKDESDIRAMGQTYGAEVKTAAGTGATTDADPFWTAPITTVSKGTLSVTASQLNAANVPEDSDDVILGKFDFEARGEAAEITRIPLGFTITTSSGSSISAADLTNVELVDENGAIVGGPLDAALQYDTEGSSILNVGVTSTDTFTVPVGKHTYTVRGDLSGDFAAGDTIVANVNNSGVTARGETTGLTLDAITGNPSSATMTIQTASLSASVSPQPVAQTVVAGAQDQLFAQIQLGAESSGEDIQVTKIKVAVKSATANPSQVSDLTLWDGTTELITSDNPDDGPAAVTTASGSATATFTLSTPLVIAKGSSKTLKLTADVSVAATSGSIRMGMDSGTAADHITAKGATSGATAAITLSANSGQSMTFTGTGTLSITRDSNFQSNQPYLMPANTDGIEIGKFNVTAQNEAINIEKLYLMGVQANAGGWQQIEKLYIYKGNDLVASVVPTSTDAEDRTVLLDMTNTPIRIERDTTTALTLKVDTSGSDYVLATAGKSGEGLWVKINAVGDITAKGADSGTTLAASAKTLSNASTTAQYLFKSVPTVTPNDQLAAGEKIGGTGSKSVENALYRFKVAANSKGDIALHHLAFEVATNIATITDMYISDGSSHVAFQPSTPGATVPAWLNIQDVGDDSWKGVGYFLFVNNQTAPTTYAGSNVVPYTISAGNTVTFTLFGTVSCAISSCGGTTADGTSNVSLLGDNALPSTLPAGGTGLSDSEADVMVNKFLWSDL